MKLIMKIKEKWIEIQIYSNDNGSFHYHRKYSSVFENADLNLIAGIDFIFSYFFFQFYFFGTFFNHKKVKRFEKKFEEIFEIATNS